MGSAGESDLPSESCVSLGNRGKISKYLTCSSLPVQSNFLNANVTGCAIIPEGSLHCSGLCSRKRKGLFCWVILNCHEIKVQFLPCHLVQFSVNLRFILFLSLHSFQRNFRFHISSSLHRPGVHYVSSSQF